MFNSIKRFLKRGINISLGKNGFFQFATGEAADRLIKKTEGK